MPIRFSATVQCDLEAGRTSNINNTSEDEEGKGPRRTGLLENGLKFISKSVDVGKIMQDILDALSSK